jgi:hypothetical protein
VLGLLIVQIKKRSVILRRRSRRWTCQESLIVQILRCAQDDKYFAQDDKKDDTAWQFASIAHSFP